MVSIWIKLNDSLGDIGNLGVREVLTTGINCFLKSNRVEENITSHTEVYRFCYFSFLFKNKRNIRTSESTVFFSPVDKLETTKI